RNRHFDFLAGRKPHALLGAAHGFRQRYRERSGDIRAAWRRFGREVFKCAASRARAAEAAEHLAENILHATASAAVARAALKSFRSEAEAFENRLAGPAPKSARAPSAAEAGKFLETRLALGVDLAAVELRALLVLAEN